MITGLLQKEISAFRQKGLYREVPATIPEGALNFSSNDYLSLRDDKLIREAYAKGVLDFPAGSGGAMGAGGYQPIHARLEQAFAKALNVDWALLFTSGYAANLGLMNLLSRISCSVVCDKSIHASVYDGFNLFKTPFKRYLHNNLEDLQKKLQSKSEPQVVMTEGIFGMSGLMPDLETMSAICGYHSASLLVDEAHSFGVLGPHGMGAVAKAGLSQDAVPLRLITFGKALGAQGAVLAGEGSWIESLLQFARPNIYSTAMSPALAFGVLQSFEYLLTLDCRRQKLQELIQYFKQQSAVLPFTWRNSDSQIQQLQLGCPRKALDYAARLRQKGIYCLAARAPTVSKKESGLRVVLNYQHEAADIDNFFRQLMCIYETQYSVSG